MGHRHSYPCPNCGYCPCCGRDGYGIGGVRDVPTDLGDIFDTGDLGDSSSGLGFDYDETEFTPNPTDDAYLDV